MQIVIEIPKSVYDYIMQIGCISMLDTQQVANAIFNGAPLPKRHGRLIDADELYIDIQTDEEMRLGNENLLWVRERIFDYAPTIIEADRGEEEWKCQ